MGVAGAVASRCERVRGVLQRVPAVEGVRPADPAGAAALRLGGGAGAGPRRQPRSGARHGPRAGGERGRGPRQVRGGAAPAPQGGLRQRAGGVGAPLRAPLPGVLRPRPVVRSAAAAARWRSASPVVLQQVHVLPQTVLYIADAETFSGHQECHEQKKGNVPASGRGWALGWRLARGQKGAR